ncbi:MAG: hypothetical protein RSE12_08585 [Fuscovulum sp.]|nr:MAG: hypothetical protein RSE12_08585 [Fuscovulum sp.]
MTPLPLLHSPLSIAVPLLLSGRLVASALHDRSGILDNHEKQIVVASMLLILGHAADSVGFCTADAPDLCLEPQVGPAARVTAIAVTAASVTITPSVITSAAGRQAKTPSLPRN